jgi:hypothetical protein
MTMILWIRFREHFKRVDGVPRDPFKWGLPEVLTAAIAALLIGFLSWTLWVEESWWLGLLSGVLPAAFVALCIWELSTDPTIYDDGAW